MKSFIRFLFIIVGLSLIFFQPSCRWFGGRFESRWAQTPQRVWVGPEYWANRLQDWRIHEGRLECINNSRSLRTVHVLTRYLNRKDGAFTMSLQTGTLSESARRTDAWAGFLLGAGSLEDDYRMRALIHQAHGRQGGLIAGINGKGEIAVIDNEDRRKPLSLQRDRQFHPSGIPESGINLHLLAIPSGKAYRLTLWARNHTSGETIDSAYIDGIGKERLQGNLALAAHIEDTSHKTSFWFKKWKMEGAKIQKSDRRQFGPVLGARYTISQGTLRMTAQMPPLSKENLKKVKLEIREKGTDEWQVAGRAGIHTPGWMATFQIGDWNSRKAWDYRMSYPLRESPEPHYMKGTIMKEPGKGSLVMAGMSGIKSMQHPIGETCHFTGDSIGFPHQRILSNILKHQPDILAYTGNQVHKNLPTSVKSDSSDDLYLDYLYKWYLFCWAHGALTRNIPTIMLPGQRDLYRRPLQVADKQRTGQTALASHHRPASFINMVQKSQTGHLPVPYDPAPNRWGIPAFYTNLQYGGLDLAIVETNKFREKDSNQTPKPQKATTGRTGALGQRQLYFLKDWTHSWKGAHIKAVISQSSITDQKILPASSGKGFASEGKTPAMSAQENQPDPEWKEALEIIRMAHALMITSGQSAAYAIHQGIHQKGDAGFEFGIPPFSCYINQTFTDTLHLSDTTAHNPETGYGIITFDISHQKIELSAWAGSTDPEEGKPYPEWPVSLGVEDNYLQHPVGFLPEIITRGLNHKPVYKLYRDNDPELIYAKRAKDSLFRPAVYDQSVYTLVLGSPEENKMDTLRNLVPVELKKQIILDFRQR